MTEVPVSDVAVQIAQDAQFVEEALHCADSGEAGHWPTVAGYLADEVRRLRGVLATRTAAVVQERNQLADTLAVIDDLAFAVMAGEGEDKRRAQDALADLLAKRIDGRLREALAAGKPPAQSTPRQPEQGDLTCPRLPDS